jgi:hypothetical protein
VRLARSRWGALLIAMVALSAAACAGDPIASPTPTSTSTSVAPSQAAAPTQTPKPTPAPLPSRTPRPPATIPPAASPWSVPGSDPAATAAVLEAVRQLGTLTSYRFESSVTGRSVLKLDEDQLLDTGAKGWLTHTPNVNVEGDFGTRMVEAAFDGAVGSSQHLVLLDGTGWGVRPNHSPEPTAVPAETLDILVGMFLPEGVAERTIRPFAEGFERVGTERHDGVATTHYRLTPGGADAYTNVTGVVGTWTGDLWIAEDGHLVAATLDGTPPPRPTPSPDPSGRDTPTWSKDRGLHVIIKITDANDPTIEVKPPA